MASCVSNALTAGFAEEQERPVGVIDSTDYLVTCPACKAEDTPRAVERGSGYGGGSWSVPDSDKFDLKFKQSYGECLIESATCQACGSEATVKITRTG